MAESLRELDLPWDTIEAIADAAEFIVEGLVYAIDNDKVARFTEWREIVEEYFDDTAAIHIAEASELAIVRAYAEDCQSVAPEDLEGEAAYQICCLARDKVSSMIDELEEVVEDHGLCFDDLTTENPCARFSPVGERTEGECEVMEYLDVKGLVKVEVWAYSFELIHPGKIWPLGTFCMEIQHHV